MSYILIKINYIGFISAFQDIGIGYQINPISVDHYSSFSPIKMHATNAKTQKFEPDPNEGFGGDCKRD